MELPTKNWWRHEEEREKMNKRGQRKKKGKRGRGKRRSFLPRVVVLWPNKLPDEWKSDLLTYWEANVGKSKDECKILFLRYAKVKKININNWKLRRKVLEGVGNWVMTSVWRMITSSKRNAQRNYYFFFYDAPYYIAIFLFRNISSTFLIWKFPF